MNRFENVDVLAALDQLMRQNTAFYRNDFEIDIVHFISARFICLLNCWTSNMAL